MFFLVHFIQRPIYFGTAISKISLSAAARPGQLLGRDPSVQFRIISQLKMELLLNISVLRATILREIRQMARYFSIKLQRVAILPVIVLIF